jgi:hypothetical protein
MRPLDTSLLPRYGDLPIRPGLPPRSAWGVFGDDDQLGTLNLLSPERVAATAALVRTGRVFPLGYDMDSAVDAMGRPPFRHVIEFDDIGADDHFETVYTQSSTCWDSMSRIAHPVHGYYNGCRPEEITGRPGSRNGIDHAARTGIVGRFVLADLGRWREGQGRPFDMLAPDRVPPAEVEACLAAQGVELRTGDVLMLRFGWLGWYAGADADQRSRGRLGTPGLSNDESMAAWLWDEHVAAVIADNATLEARPIDWDSDDGVLHRRLIPLLGITVGELFALDDLAGSCAGDGVYEGLFVAAPINKIGAVGSPGNALAIR